MAEREEDKVLEPRLIKGARALLFDRLVDEEVHQEEEARPLRVHDEYSLRKSVQQELMRLLNTRCPGTRWPLDPEDRTVLDYGIPDFSWMSAASGADREELGRIIERAIAAYEPRLRDVQVAFTPSPDNRSAVRGEIHAVLLLEKLKEPVSFQLVITLKEGVIEIAD